MQPAGIDHATDARDLREGGRWSAAQRAKNNALYILATVLLGLAVRIPAWSRRAIARALGACAHRLLSRERKLAESNARRALGLSARAARDFVRTNFVTLSKNLADTVSLFAEHRLTVRFPLDAQSDHVLRNALAEGRGVVFASAHLGPWERVAASLIADGVPLVTLARRAYDPRLTAILVALRERHGVRAIFRGEPETSARIADVLARGMLLGAPMDLLSRVPTVDAPLLGVPARTASGPARIALRSGAAVVVGTFAPGPAIRVTRVQSNDLTNDTTGVAELTRRINAELSERILACPEHWVWMHNRFDAADNEALPALE